uniref:Putative secreted protein n=1 Tax=Ixodes ricinus TaxID=34613 RepID=A0A6B0UGS2_IXORI
MSSSTTSSSRKGKYILISSAMLCLSCGHPVRITVVSFCKVSSFRVALRIFSAVSFRTGKWFTTLMSSSCCSHRSSGKNARDIVSASRSSFPGRYCRSML